MRKILRVEPLDNYRLIAEFDNGEKRIADIMPLIKNKKIFAPLENAALFSTAYVDYGAVTWLINGNEVDICPDKLYMDSAPYQSDIPN